MNDLTLSEDLIKFIDESYKTYKLIYDENTTLDEFIKNKLSIKDSFINVLKSNSDLKWVSENFNEKELSIIRTKYNDKKHFLANEADVEITNNLKISIIKNCAAEMYVQKLLNIKDLRTQKFKVIFSITAKLDSPEWTLLSIKKSWYKRDKPYLNKDYAIIVTLDENNKPYILSIIDKTTFNKHAIKSHYTDHIIIKGELFKDVIDKKDKYLTEIKKSIMYQTHIDHKTYSALSKLKKSHFTELKNAEELFELIVEFWHDKLKLKNITSKLDDTLQYYYADTKKRVINYNKICKDQLHEIIQYNSTYTPDILIRTAFNNVSMLKSWYLNKSK